MTPDERALLQAAGNSLSDDLLQISITVLFFGVYTGLCILAYLSLLERGFGTSWARWAQLVALLVNFLTTIGSSMAYAANFAIIPNSQWHVIVADRSPSLITSDWTQQISLLINDAVVIWRAWVLYRGRPVVLFSLCLVFCATLATSFAAGVFQNQVIIALNSPLDISSSGVSTESSMGNTLNVAATALSLATNLFATALISILLWRHRRFRDRSGLDRHSLTSSQRILLFLIEAGLTFCIGQALDFCINIYFNTKGNIALGTYFTLVAIDTTFWALMPMILPAIILLVENNRNITETFNLDSKVLVEVAHVEAAGHLEQGPKSSTT